MRKLSKVTIAIVSALLAVVMATPASACTGVIVGGDLTRDGSTIFGRTEDDEENHPKIMKIHPAGEFSKGEKIKGTWTDSTYQMTKPSLKFTSISDVMTENGNFDAAGFNEKGVGVDATVSAGASKKILDLDPYLNGNNGNAATGWEEGEVTRVLLANAQTAREAIELMAGLIDKDGMAEGDILVVGDKNELWYMELYSGHQYAAIKYPRDKYAVFPNAFWLDQVNCQDKENTICSAKLEEIPKEAETYVETDGKFNPAKSYNPEKAQTSGRNLYRIWSGLKVLDPDNPVTLEATDFTLFNSLKSGKKIDLAQVMAMQRNRFQGIDDQLAKLSQKVVKDRDFIGTDGEPVEGAKHSIGNTNTMEAHIFQFPKSQMPAAVPGTLWQTIGTPQGSPYLPYYGNITQIIPAQQTAKPSPFDPDKNANPRREYVEQPESYYWVASAINLDLGENREVLENPVSQYLNLIEQPLRENRIQQDQELVRKYRSDPQEAARWATQDYARISEQAFQDLLALKESLDVWDTDHDLVSSQVDGKLSVAAGDIILPTVFNISRLADLKIPTALPENMKSQPAWVLSLKQKLPNQQTKDIDLDYPTPVSIKLSEKEAEAITDQTKLYLVQGDELTEVPYQVDGQELSFTADRMGVYGLGDTNPVANASDKPGDKQKQSNTGLRITDKRMNRLLRGKGISRTKISNRKTQNNEQVSARELSSTGSEQRETLLFSICLLGLGGGLLGYRKYRISRLDKKHQTRIAATSAR